jgi:hypothetical protein
MNTKQIFDKLWKEYAGQNPSVQKVYDLFVDKGEKVENDHIAFRTFDDPRVNIEVLSQVFLSAGYVEKGEYHFEEKKLYAKHYEIPNDKNAPRVFISQLKTKELSAFLQNTITDALSSIDQEIYKSEDLIFSGRVWAKPSFATYNKLREESEYAAWLYVYGFMANHFTISINSLKNFNTIEKVNATLKENGFLMNDSGGEIKGTPAELLEQSSIKSEIINMEFIEGVYEIPGCYYEFARRYPDASGKLYSGFIAKSADKIFESTNFYKK